MSDALSFAEIDVAHVELLPARTVLSMFRVSVGGDTGNGGQGGKGGVGGEGEGKAYFLYPYFYTEGDVTNSLTGGAGGAESADGGTTTGGAGTISPAPAAAPAATAPAS